MSWILRAAPAAVVAISLSSGALFAQSERGTVTGTVRDSSGAVVANAAVKITNTATNTAISTTSNDSGDYVVPNVAAGTYTVRVQKQGFRTFELVSVPVDASTSVRADAVLEVGAARQAIEVQAAAVQLQTEDAK